MQTKYRLLLAAVIISTSLQIASAEVVPLSSAVNNKWVKVTFRATGTLAGVNDNSHIGKCVSYQLQNISGRPLTLNLEAGYMFKPEDTTIQPLLFTDNSSWTLAAGGVAAGYLNAMCAALHKGSPQKDRSYKLGNLTNGVMKKFAQLVAKKKYQTTEAQSVLWAITNKSDLYGKLNGNSQMCNDLVSFVKTEMKIDPSKKGQIYIPKKEVEKTVSVRVSESFQTTDSGTFAIQIVDAKGKVKLQQNVSNKQPAGQIEYAFWIGSTDLELGKYKVIYLINNKEAYRSEFELKLEE